MLNLIVIVTQGGKECIVMCGRFTLTLSKEVIESALDIMLEELEPNYNVAPTQNVLSVVAGSEERRAGFMRWGLIPSWAKDKKIGSKMINARSETADQMPSFKPLLSRRRCLIVADSFYEWDQKGEEKQPYRFQLKNEPIITFAGLWDRWQDEENEIISCTILTTDANQDMEKFHHRMPVILDKDKREQWLDRKLTDHASLKSLLTPLPEGSITYYPISKKVNSPKNNNPDLLTPIENQ